MLVLWRKPLNVETADYVQIPWVWPRGVLPKTQKRSNAPHAGHAFATNPLLSPWVARGLPGGRPLGMAADTRIMAGEVQKIYIFLHGKLNEIMITIIIIIIIMVVGALGKRVKIFITKPQLKSYLQSTCCYKKSN